MSRQLLCMFPWKPAGVTLLSCMTFLLFAAAFAAQLPEDDAPARAAAKPTLTADEITDRLQERNREREEALLGFEGIRVYRVRYHGFFGTLDAEEVVRCKYVSPNTVQFTVLSQQGSKLLLQHVIAGLLNAEKEAATIENRRRTALTVANYKFTRDDSDADPNESEYVLDVTPKNDSKFLYRGRIWIDAKDFAVTKIEAEPAKNPSFWITKTAVHHRYQRVGSFWFPAENISVSSIRMGGSAQLSIEYKDYAVADADQLNAPVRFGDNGDEPPAPKDTALH